MSGPERIDPTQTNINISLQQEMFAERNSRNSGKYKFTDRNIKISGKKNLLEGITYEKPEPKGEEPEPANAIRRPLHVDKSNNIFYINHEGENESVQIEPGDYNLMEFRQAIQDKVNESFGIGKVKVDLTGSGSDRLIQAEDSKIFDFLE